jgi:hypothetical protein
MSTTTTTRSRKAAGATGTDWLRKQAGKVSAGEELPITAEDNYRFGVEEWLQSRGVLYAPPVEIPMGLIDETRSRNNQARRESIVPESVERYAAAMRANAPFPPIVCYPDNGRLVIVDGNNRQAAARRAGKDTILGIVLAEETSSEVLQLLTVEANARHGVTPEASWRVHQAMALSALGWPDQAVAEATGMTMAALRNARTVIDADTRGRSLRIAGFADLPASSKTALSAVKDDAVFQQLSRLAVGTNMIADEIRDCTRTMRGLPSEASRLQHIAEVAKERTSVRAVRRAVKTGAHSRVHSHRVALLAATGKVLTVEPAGLVAQVGTALDQAALLKKIGEAKRHLTLCEVALRSMQVSAVEFSAATTE